MSSNRFEIQSPILLTNSGIEAGYEEASRIQLSPYEKAPITALSNLVDAVIQIEGLPLKDGTQEVPGASMVWVYSSARNLGTFFIPFGPDQDLPGMCAVTLNSGNEEIQPKIRSRFLSRVQAFWQEKVAGKERKRGLILYPSYFGADRVGLLYEEKGEYLAIERVGIVGSNEWFDMERLMPLSPDNFSDYKFEFDWRRYPGYLDWEIELANLNRSRSAKMIPTDISFGSL